MVKYKKEKGDTMTNIVKRSYRVRRENKEMYNGFGFAHLSEAINYYIHPDNHSYNMTITLAQHCGYTKIAELTISSIAHSDPSYKRFFTNLVEGIV